VRAANLPCEGSELATVFRSLGEAVEVRTPDASTDARLEDLAFDGDGATVIAMKWSGDDDDNIWLLAEDLLAEQALTDAGSFAASQ